MKKILCLLCIAVVGRSAFETTATKLEVWTTTGDRKIEMQRTQILEPNTGFQADDVELQVDTSQRAQTIVGFGAAITNAAAFNIYKSPMKDQLIGDLFTYSGINISYIRLTLGASDFQAVSPYTYDDVNTSETDFNMDKFSIEKDEDFVLPLLREIKARNSNFSILASPWSPPAWMKDSGGLFGGALKNDSTYREALAKYYLKAMQAYKAQGFEFDALTIQNEPLYSSGGYPTMYMPPEVQRDIIGKYLGPAMKKEKLNTKVIVYDHNCDNIDYARLILNDSQASQYVSGSAWHCYADMKYNAQPAVIKKEFPNKDLYFTECTGGFWATNFWDNLNWNYHNVFFAHLQNGARTVLLWNMALDEQHGPRVGVYGCSNCRGVVTVKPDGSYLRNEEYYNIGHFSKFMNRGTVIVKNSFSDSQGLEAAAGRRPDGTAVVVLMNTRQDNVTLTLKVDSTEFRGVFLPAQSIATLSEVQS